MSVKIESGIWHTAWVPKKASTAFATNSFVELDSGYVDVATTTTGGADTPLFGVYGGPAITSATTGRYLYSNTALLPVYVPCGMAMVRATTSASIGATTVGKGLDLSDSVTVHASNNTYSPVTCMKYITTTEGLFTLSHTPISNVA